MAMIARLGLKARDPRTTVLLPSRMRIESAWSDACIHNVSARGLLVSADDAPRAGAYVEIRRGRAVIIGRAVWQKDRFFGVRTQDRIYLAVLQGGPAQNDNAPRNDRRHADRYQQDAAVARSLERNRAFARLFQFGVVALGVGFVGWIAASSVYSVLSKPAERITNAMAAAR
ncbi:PilZ domain-containing protein [Sphingomonas panacisoli]|uniref:PilZ domain-containing protein n=1 Tax=Sphingomonas panacisoli TaxID=1813879 RepID=A0A5B8LK33_9SPHN|nr:PilZ domain-containing protein [Sphingomonas panacisoli]QDZ08491.1 PilZ domain-containing protein [Sphingomonas panacisoli]